MTDAGTTPPPVLPESIPIAPSKWGCLGSVILAGLVGGVTGWMCLHRRPCRGDQRPHWRRNRFADRPDPVSTGRGVYRRAGSVPAIRPSVADEAISLPSANTRRPVPRP